MLFSFPSIHVVLHSNIKADSHFFLALYKSNYIILGITTAIKLTPLSASLSFISQSPPTSVSFPPPFLSLPVFASMASSTPATSFPGYQDHASVNSYHSSGSIGLFLAVMFVIIVLTALSCIFGRICASQMAEGPDSSYDCMSWVRRSYQHNRCVLTHCIMKEAKLDSRVNEGSQLPAPSSEP